MPVDDLPCNELVELVTEYLEGVLLPELADRFERHLAACPFCQEYLQQIRRTITLTGRIREEDLDPEAKHRLLEAFRRWHEPQDL